MPAKSSPTPTPVERRMRVENARACFNFLSRPWCHPSVSANAYAVDPARVGMADNTHCKQGRSELAGEGPKGFGGLASSLNVRETVAVEGDRSGQDDKKHDHIREKRADAHIHLPQLKFFDRCS